MKSALTTAVAVMLTVCLYAKDPAKYPISGIPEALRKDAKAVVRDDEMTVTVNSVRNVSVHSHFAVTIFTPNGRDYASRAIGYDKMRKIKDLKAIAYDQYGNLIKKMKSSDFTDQSSYDGFSLYSDNRLKYFDLAQSNYPYTVELEFDMEYNYTYIIPGNAVTMDENVAVQNFSYELIYPKELKPRVKVYNIENPVVTTTLSNGMESSRWVLKDIAPMTAEPMSSRAKYIKEIVAAPNQFEMDGYPGNMSSWEEIGKWFGKLNAGRDQLPEATKAKIRELVKDAKTDEEKVKVLYEYLQSKTRYVSIQLGIGGLQTFEATVVDKNGYGDCKALSNYMVAMLKEVKIPAYYSIIESGYSISPLDETFPQDYGNHIIVAVPMKKDTIWLECTNQTIPFGYLGTFTDNRAALLVTENGGKLVRTPHYHTSQNVQSTTADVELDLLGNAKAKVKAQYSGLQYENGGLNDYVNSSTDEQKKWIQKNTSIPSFDIAAFSMTNKKDRIPTATVKMDLVLNKYASVSNKRIFVTPNLLNRWTNIPQKVENRKSPFNLRLGFTDIDTIKYHIPESIYPEFLPPVQKFTSRFGTYEAEFKLDAGSLIYIRRFTRNDGEFPAESYQELIDFYKSINKADNVKLVFLNKT